MDLGFGRRHFFVHDRKHNEVLTQIAALFSPALGLVFKSKPKHRHVKVDIVGCAVRRIEFRRSVVVRERDFQHTGLSVETSGRCAPAIRGRRARNQACKRHHSSSSQNIDIAERSIPSKQKGSRQPRWSQ